MMFLFLCTNNVRKQKTEFLILLGENILDYEIIYYNSGHAYTGKNETWFIKGKKKKIMQGYFGEILVL